MSSKPGMEYEITSDLEYCRDWLRRTFDVVGNDMVITIGLKHQGELIAVTGFNNFDKDSCMMHFYLTSGNFTRRYIKAVLHYAFRTAGIKTLIGFLNKDKHELIAISKRIGFVDKYELSEANMLLMTLNENDCKRWL